MRESRFVLARADPICEFQERRERQTLFKTGPSPLRVRFPPNASDMQAPGLPPDRAPLLLASSSVFDALPSRRDDHGQQWRCVSSPGTLIRFDFASIMFVDWLPNGPRTFFV